MPTSPKSSGDHEISLEKAIQLTTKYRNEKNKMVKPEYAGKELLPVCETFDRSAFELLLAEEGCASIRAYFCMDENLNVKLLFVAANAKNEDMLPVDSALLGGSYSIMDNGHRCPPECPPPSPLNPTP